MAGEHLSGGVARGRWNPQLIERDFRLGKCMVKSEAIGHRRRERAEPIEDGVRLTSIERFLKAITPRVPAHCSSKMAMRDWRGSNVGYESHFVLDDLWESFKEWSAYGAGVPLLLNGRDYVVQYYVPYLSAIQIYVDPTKSSPISSSSKVALPSIMRRSQENEGKCIVKDSRVQHISCHQTTDLWPKMENNTLKDQPTDVKEGFSGDDDGGSVNSQGCLLYQYLEQDTPFSRDPLFYKISDLALDFPELRTLRSCDMLSTSWISVAWYPIYRIPTGPPIRDLEACFLTYHSLSTQPLPLGDASGVQAPILTNPNGIDGIPKIPLPTFGLSSYKYRGSMWTSGISSGQQMVNSLSEAASNWLRALQVHHPDYNFFASRR